jgi:hypothetical protein
MGTQPGMTMSSPAESTNWIMAVAFITASAGEQPSAVRMRVASRNRTMGLTGLTEPNSRPGAQRLADVLGVDLQRTVGNRLVEGSLDCVLERFTRSRRDPGRERLDGS